MRETLNLIVHVMNTINTYGKYNALFFAGILCLCLSINQIDRKYLSYTLLSFLFVMNPVTTSFIIKVFPELKDYWRILFVIPTFGTIAYGTAVFSDKIWRLKKKRQIITAVGFIFLIACCGTMIPSISFPTKAESWYGVSEAELATLKELDGETEVRLLASDQIMSAARKYDGNIQAIYGRDLWSSSVTTKVLDAYGEDTYQLHEWMQAPAEHLGDIEDLAEKLRCTYLILGKKDSAHFKQDKYELFAQTDQYNIYKRM